MPYTSINRDAGVGPSAITLRLPVSRGHLKAVSVSQIAGDSNPGALHVTCSLSAEPATPETMIAFLFAGAFTTYHPIGWSGDLPLEEEMTVYARFRTYGQANIKLAIVTEL